MKRGVLIAGALGLLAILAWLAVPMRHRSAGPPAGFSAPPEALAKLETLREILRSQNDNDPRLDSGFNGLSPGTKELFRREYRKLPPERRNERGTIVFLLGKNLRSAEDWAVLRGVAGEPPCLSLSDCSKKAEPGTGGEELGDEVTLAYPSLVALKQAQRARREAPETRGAETAKEALGVIEAAKNSKMRAVVRLAGRLEREFKAPRP